MHLSHLSVRRPIATSMLLVAACMLGTVSLARLDVALLPETRAEALGVSARTADTWWAYARAWLAVELGNP